MDFSNRIKKEMTEGIVRAILADAGYRVIGLGIENVIREVECLPALEYAGLDFPKAIRSLPDLLVMNRGQTEKTLVEIKYRSGWSVGILDEIEEQVKIFKELTLIYLNSVPRFPSPNITPSPSSYLRCCKVRAGENEIEAFLEVFKDKKWVPRSEIKDQPGVWWGLRPLQESFTQLNDTKDDHTLFSAIAAIKGILNDPSQSG